MWHNSNNMGVIWVQQYNKWYNYNSNGVITSIIGTQQKTYRMVMVGTIIDEGASVSILSSTSWKALGSPSFFLR